METIVPGFRERSVVARDNRSCQASKLVSYRRLDCEYGFRRSLVDGERSEVGLGSAPNVFDTFPGL